MWRPFSIVGLVGVLVATGVAFAAPAAETRLPVTMSQGESAASAAVDEVVVAKGDHLWKISSRHLASHSPSTAVAPYWLQVIETNMPTLRSGDPDLIYPGEVVRLPGLSERP